MSPLLFFLSKHAFFILPISIIFSILCFVSLRKLFPRAVYLCFVFPVFGLLSLLFAGDWNASYVYKNGVKGEGIVLSMTPTNNYINHVQVVEYNCLLKLSDGSQVKAVFENSNSIFYPPNDLVILPTVGKVFPIIYMEGDETNFIIPTDSTNVELNCMELLQELSSAQAAYELDKSNQKNKMEYINEINQYLSHPCDTNMQMAFKMVLKQLN